MSIASSELLREALVDLQRVRDREASQRAQVELIFDALKAVTNAELDNPFGPLFSILIERLNLSCVLILSPSTDDDSVLVPRATSSKEAKQWRLPILGPVKRALTGKTVGVADVSKVPAFADAPFLHSGDIRSLILIGVAADDEVGVLLFGHAAQNGFGRAELRSARELAVVVNGGLARWRARQREHHLLQEIIQKNEALKTEILERERAEKEAQEQREIADRLLHTILPAPIVRRLKETPGIIADSIDEATVMFSDLVGFTKISTELTPQELVQMLNRIFSEFDTIASAHGLERIKTIGDAYMLGSGILKMEAHRPQAVADVALSMMDVIDDISMEFDHDLKCRIGIHTGPIVAGIIGTRKFAYDIWGDTVNVASRMESHGIAGRIHLSQHARLTIGNTYQFDDRGDISIKGKGVMKTCFLLGKL